MQWNLPRHTPRRGVSLSAGGRHRARGRPTWRSIANNWRRITRLDRPVPLSTAPSSSRGSLARHRGFLLASNHPSAQATPPGNSGGVFAFARSNRAPRHCLVRGRSPADQAGVCNGYNPIRTSFQPRVTGPARQRLDGYPFTSLHAKELALGKAVILCRRPVRGFHRR